MILKAIKGGVSNFSTVSYVKGHAGAVSIMDACDSAEDESKLWLHLIAIVFAINTKTISVPLSGPIALLDHPNSTSIQVGPLDR